MHRYYFNVTTKTVIIFSLFTILFNACSKNKDVDRDSLIPPQGRCQGLSNEECADFNERLLQGRKDIDKKTELVDQIDQLITKEEQLHSDVDKFCFDDATEDEKKCELAQEALKSHLGEKKK